MMDEPVEIMLKIDVIIKSLSDLDGFSYQVIIYSEVVYEEVYGEFKLTTVALRKNNFKVNRIVSAISEFEVEWLLENFDEGSQLQLGYYLYNLIFKEKLKRIVDKEDQVNMRIISDNSLIRALPWNLLVKDNTFLIFNGWHFSIATNSKSYQPEVNMPITPSILLVSSEPDDFPENKSASHIKMLRYSLESHNKSYSDPDNLSVATSLDEFIAKLECRYWDVIYFYGHGRGDGLSASIFFSDNNGKAISFSMAKLANILSKKPPRLLYLNACRSGAGTIGSAITHLEELVPAIVVNRTDAFLSSAQSQAQTFLERLLLNHKTPHQAITAAYQNNDLGMCTARWLTPLLYQQYKQWNFPTRGIPAFARIDPFWMLKLDRRPQFSIVNTYVRQMISEKHPQTLACFWYGTKQQGVERFHERLPLDLRKLNPDMEVLKFSFVWPDHFRDENEAFEFMLCEGFRIPQIEGLPGKIQSMSVTSGTLPVVAYCRFANAYEGGKVKLLNILGLLNWWNTHVHELLKSRGLKAILAISYELLKEDSRFKKALRETIHTLQPKVGMKLKVLDEIRSVTEEDIKEFLDDHAVDLPVSVKQRDQLVADSIAKARLENGEVDYEKVLCELWTIVPRAHTLVGQSIASQTTESHPW